MSILICASRADEATEITYNFSQSIRRYAADKGISGVYLGDRDACPEKVQAELSKKPKGFFFFNHGSDEFLYGEDSNTGAIVAVIGPYNVALLKGVIVDALACLSVKYLGPEAVKEGCIAYVGYDEVTYVVNDEDCERVMDTSKRALLDGKTVNEAYQMQRLAYVDPPPSCKVAKGVRIIFGSRVLKILRTIRNALTGHQPNILVHEFYEWNVAHYVLLGDGDAKIL